LPSTFFPPQPTFHLVLVLLETLSGLEFLFLLTLPLSATGLIVRLDDPFFAPPFSSFDEEDTGRLDLLLGVNAFGL